METKQMLGWINLQEEDPEVCEVIRQEVKRQCNKLELIASENYTSRAVLETPLEIAHLSEIANKVDYSRLPIFQIESRLDKSFQFNPLKMFSSGALVVTIPSEKVESAYRALHEMGIPFATIGGVTEGTGVRIFKDEDIIHHD